MSTIAQITGSVLSAAISVVVLHLSTAHLGPTDYGYLTTIVALISVLSLLTDLGLTALTARDVARDPAAAEEIITDNLSLRVTLAVLIVPCATASAYVLYPAHRSIVTLGVLLMSGDILLGALQTTSMTYFAARTRNDVAALVLLAGKCVYLLAVGVASAVHRSVFLYVAAYLVGDGFAALVAVTRLRRHIHVRFRVRRGAWRRILVTFPLGLLQVIGTIYLWAGTVFLSLLASPADVAFYGVCSGFLILVSTMAGYFMGAVVPTLATAERSAVRGIVQRSWDIMSLLAVPVATGAVVLRREVIGAVAGPRFAHASTPFAILGVVVGLMFMNNVFAYASIALDTFRRLVWIQLPCLLVQVVLDLVLVPTLGVAGAGIAILVSELCSLGVTIAVFRCQARIPVSPRYLWRPLTGAAAMVLADLLLRPLWVGPSVALDAAVGASVLGMAYLLALAAVDGLPPEVTAAGKRFLTGGLRWVGARGGMR